MYNTQISEGLSITNTISKLIKDVNPFRDERILLINPTKGALPAVKFLFPTSEIDICDIITDGERRDYTNYDKMNICENSFYVKAGSPVGYYDIIIANESDTLKGNLSYLLDLPYGRLILLGDGEGTDYNYKYIVKRVEGSSRVCSIHILNSNDGAFSHCSLLVEHYTKESAMSNEVQQLMKKLNSEFSDLSGFKKEVESVCKTMMDFIKVQNETKPTIFEIIDTVAENVPSKSVDLSSIMVNENPPSEETLSGDIDMTQPPAETVSIKVSDNINDLTVEERNKVIVDMVDSGKTPTETARELGIAYHKVRYALERTGRPEFKRK
jgi:hypothetical protein